MFLDTDGRMRSWLDGPMRLMNRDSFLFVVTRNIGDFQPMGVELLNPWE